jgi:hypothetical protein
MRMQRKMQVVGLEDGNFNGCSHARGFALYFDEYMKLYLDCYPCILNQAITACRTAGISEPDQKEIFKEILQLLVRANPENPPIDLVADVHALIKGKTGIEDLYLKQKHEGTQAALALSVHAKEIIDLSPDPFDTAVRMSIAGNIIDFGVNDSYDLSAEIERVITQPYAINHLEYLREDLRKGSRILFLSDNAGETVFDRLLIETIGKEVVYAVKEKPILNDALQADAIEAGLDRVAKIVSSGVDSPGTLLSRASEDFLQIYYAADVIIAKGQGNFEALSGQSENIYFLFQTKCQTLARTIGTSVGGMIVKNARRA